MRSSALLWLVFVANSFWASAQNLDEPGRFPIDYDTNYISDFRHRLNAAFVSELKGNGIGIVTPQNKVLIYRTNLALPQYGFMASYRWLNVQLSVPVPFLSYHRPNRSETDALAMAVGLTGRKYFARAFYERFTGYYLANPEVVFPGLENNINLDFPNMVSQTYYATGYMAVNGEKYSNRNLLWQCEIQKKSAGSVLLGMVAGLKQISAPNDLLPGIIEQTANHARYVLVGLTGGYAYTFVLGNSLNTSLSFMPGVNYTWGSYGLQNSDDNVFNNNIGFNAEIRWQMLYHHKNYYGGLSFTAYAITDFVKQEYPVASAHNYLKVNVGYRFRVKPIKFLKPFNLSN